MKIIIILAGLIMIVEFVVMCITFLLVRKKNLLKLFSPQKILEIGEAYIGQKAETLSDDENQESSIKEVAYIWARNARIPLCVLIVSILASAYIWKNFYIVAILVMVFVNLFNSVFLGLSWKLGVEIGLTSKQYLDSLWRHGFMEFFSMNLLWAMACLNAWNAALVICGVVGLLIASIIENTLSKAVTLSLRDQCQFVPVTKQDNLKL